MNEQPSVLTVLKQMVGREHTYTDEFEVEKGMINRFAIAIGDSNPLYSDEEFARSTPYGGVIAPPTFLFEWNHHKHSVLAPEVRKPMFADFDRQPTVLRGVNEYEFVHPVRPGDSDRSLKALIFDSHYDPFRGTIVNIRVFQGRIKPGDQISFMSSFATHRVEEVGIFQIDRIPQKQLFAGQVGYVIAGIKSLRDVRCGDTITLRDHPCKNPLPGFKKAKPVVFSSIYPVASDGYDELATAIEKLQLNDASLVYEKDTSQALGFGFRCGFLGLLHLEVVQERLEREYDISLIMTAPSVEYRLTMTDGELITIDNPALYPDPSQIEYAKEPFIRASILTPDRYMGSIMRLCLDRRGINRNYQYLANGRLEMTFDLPLAEVIYDFYDRLKSVTQGYGSFDYELIDFRDTDLAKLDILINGERVDALSQLVHKEGAVQRARHACEKLRDEIPRQMFKVAIQGAIGGQIIARKTISAFRKDVTAKCYGGDISRKRKLLEKQKKGKKRMKMVGKVMIPQSAFLSVLKTDTDA
ncbi:translation elongation factor 4 [Thermodesulfobacteriota bacterium]